MFDCHINYTLDKNGKCSNTNIYFDKSKENKILILFKEIAFE